MWIASKLGWFSIVEKEKGQFHVRARVRKDLENLIKASRIVSMIQEWPGADYRYRVIVNRKHLHQIYGALESSVDYRNFKSEIAVTPDQCDKLGAYHTIWAQMAALQED